MASAQQHEIASICQGLCVVTLCSMCSLHAERTAVRHGLIVPASRIGSRHSGIQSKTLESLQMTIALCEDIEAEVMLKEGGGAFEGQGWRCMVSCMGCLI